MSLPFDDWLDQAQALPLGRSRRVNHCNNKQTMKINHGDDGYSAYCFRCNEGGFKAHGERRIRDLFAEKEFCYANDIRLPDDFTLDVPDGAAVWYYRYGIGADLARQYGIGWSARLNRVVLPVYNGSTLVAVQARAVASWQQPKYLNQEGNKKALTLFKSLSYKEVDQGTGLEGAKDSWIVITEDILSCIRVGQVMPCVCPMGTSLSPAQAGQLIGYTGAIIWLDNDTAGVTGSAKMQRMLHHVMRTRILTAQADPKCYDNHAIKQLIQRSTHGD